MNVLLLNSNHENTNETSQITTLVVVKLSFSVLRIGISVDVYFLLLMPLSELIVLLFKVIEATAD